MFLYFFDIFFGFVRKKSVEKKKKSPIIIFPVSTTTEFCVFFGSFKLLSDVIFRYLRNLVSTKITFHNSTMCTVGREICFFFDMIGKLLLITINTEYDFSLYLP